MHLKNPVIKNVQNLTEKKRELNQMYKQKTLNNVFWLFLNLWRKTGI